LLSQERLPLTEQFGPPRSRGGERGLNARVSLGGIRTLHLPVL
jgi:hypothetical protein